MRAGTVSSDAQAAVLQREADVILAPPLESVDLLDWKAFDRIVELGYRYTMTQLERDDASPLDRIVSAVAPTTGKE
jgi:NTE family protein